MLDGVFYWILNMSIAATVAGGFVWLFGRIKAVPRRFAHALWLIPAVRMWIPIGMGSNCSILTALTRLIHRPIPVRYHAYPKFTSMNFICEVDRYYPMSFKAQWLDNVINIAAVVWIAVAAIGLAMLGVFYAVTKADLRDARPIGGNIYVSKKVSAPAVYGVLKPKILLPEHMADAAGLEFILAHENAHIKRKDNLWRMAALVTTVIHWFNPFAWLFLRSFLSDTEFACDEHVVEGLHGTEKRQAYALALVEAAEKRMAFSSPFGGASIRARVQTILDYKKRPFMSLVCLAMMCGVLVLILLTNAL